MSPLTVGVIAVITIFFDQPKGFIQRVGLGVLAFMLFGICLGHQLLGLALGARTFKLKFGHRGANQPVLNQLTNRVEITTQNHGFAVRLDDLPKVLEPTHINLNDQTLEGMRGTSLRCFSVQYHPEASAWPHDSGYLFEQFREWMG